VEPGLRCMALPWRCGAVKGRKRTQPRGRARASAPEPRLTCVLLRAVNAENGAPGQCGALPLQQQHVPGVRRGQPPQHPRVRRAPRCPPPPPAIQRELLLRQRKEWVGAGAADGGTVVRAVGDPLAPAAGA